MQHFHFALWAMADVDSQAAVVSRQRTLALTAGELLRGAPCHRGVAQIQNIGLKVMQQVIGGDIDKGVQLFIALQPGQQIDIIAPELAPRGQQRVANILLAIIIKQPRRLFSVAEQRQLARLAVVAALARHQFGKKRRIFNIAPVVATGVSEEYIDIDVLAQRLQGLQIHRRQRGDAADKAPRRQPGWRLVSIFQRADKALVQISAVP